MPLVIAEAGVNHRGSIEVAVDLVEEAAHAGADVVKFQLFDSEYLEEPGLREYQLSIHHMRLLRRVAEQFNLDFLCTPFSLPEAMDLHAMGLTLVKLSSRHTTDLELIRYCSQAFEWVYLSTGNPWGPPRSLPQVLAALEGLDNITLMHCVSKYPTQPMDAHLATIPWLQEHWHSVGYSDHTQGITAAICATALGVDVIEKHLTLGAATPDLPVSLVPWEFQYMVERVREAQVMCG